MLNKIEGALKLLGPNASKLMIKGQWIMRETKDGYTFRRAEVKNPNESAEDEHERVHHGW